MNVYAQLNTVTDKRTKMDVYEGERKTDTVTIDHRPGAYVQAARNVLTAQGYPGKAMRFAASAVGMALIS